MRLYVLGEYYTFLTYTVSSRYSRRTGHQGPVQLQQPRFTPRVRYTVYVPQDDIQRSYERVLAGKSDMNLSTLSQI